MGHPLLIVIPARLGSYRLLNKPLKMVGDEPLIHRVVQRVLAMDLDAEVVVATDSALVARAVSAAAPVIMTSLSHRNGTERVAEVARLLESTDTEVVINVQGDMPFIPKEAVIGAVKRVLLDGDDVGTVVARVPSGVDTMIADPNRVKAVVDGLGMCVAFYRLASWGDWPFPPLAMGLAEHVGVYAYRPDTLQRWATLPPTKLERELELEQVRALTAGMKIGASWLAEPAPLAVDTQDDLIEARRLLQEALV